MRDAMSQLLILEDCEDFQPDFGIYLDSKSFEKSHQRISEVLLIAIGGLFV